MSEQVRLTEAERALAEVLGDIRVAGAKEADWWTDDDDHSLLERVLRAECEPWAVGLLASDWLAAREKPLREALGRVEALADVVRRLQEPDPDTGDRDVSFFALVEALHPDDEDIAVPTPAAPVPDASGEGA